MNSETTLLKTPLHDWHAEHGGRMVDFAGWSMPVQYGSIIDEHHQTRKAIGMFDVSHMGRLFFSGPDVDQALDRLTTRKVAGMGVGRIRYSLMCNQEGGILDDVLVYHLPDQNGDPFYMMVVNASNRQKILDWLHAHIPDDSGIRIDDRTEQTAMIAVQGPKANAMVSELSSVDPNELKYYTGTSAQIMDVPAILSRTGYTGEDGCELIVDAERAVGIWSELVARAAEREGGASGLAARDTLRLEAAMPLYGHELREDINPAQTGLEFAISLHDRDFIGRDAIIEAENNETLPHRVGLVVSGKRPAREGCRILVDGDDKGEITSGTYSPTLNKSISMGYVLRDYTDPGTELVIDIRGKETPAIVVKMPFYSRPK